MSAISRLWKVAVEVYQDEAAWSAGRRTGIGASESASIFGVGYKSASPITVWASKVGHEQPEFDAETKAMFRRGHKLEPVIASEFTEETGLICQDPGDYTIFRSIEHPWMFATLDRITIHPDWGPVPVELKAVNGRFRNDWDEDSEPPLKFTVQAQHQMAVTGASHCYLVGFIGGDELVIRVIERNNRFIEQALIPRLHEFWGYVQRNEMPPVDESEATRAMLGKIYPNDSGDEIFADPESTLIEDDRELLELKEQRKTIETRIDGIENRIKATIGNATKLILPVGAYSWKEQTRRGIDADGLRAEFPSIAAQFEKVSSFRVLRRSNK